MSKNCPFSNGTQYLDWELNNCGECGRREGCDIADYISGDGMHDAEFRPDIAERMGWKPGPPIRYVWRCPERIAKGGE